MGLAIFLIHACVVSMLVAYPYADKVKQEKPNELKKPKIEKYTYPCA